MINQTIPPGNHKQATCISIRTIKIRTYTKKEIILISNNYK